jgi:hypothetical protein
VVDLKMKMEGRKKLSIDAGTYIHSRMQIAIHSRLGCAMAKSCPSIW